MSILDYWKQEWEHAQPNNVQEQYDLTSQWVQAMNNFPALRSDMVSDYENIRRNRHASTADRRALEQRQLGDLRPEERANRLQAYEDTLAENYTVYNHAFEYLSTQPDFEARGFVEKDIDETFATYNVFLQTAITILSNLSAADAPGPYQLPAQLPPQLPAQQPNIMHWDPSIPLEHPNPLIPMPRLPQNRYPIHPSDNHWVFHYQPILERANASPDPTDSVRATDAAAAVENRDNSAAWQLNELMYSLFTAEEQRKWRADQLANYKQYQIDLDSYNRVTGSNVQPVAGPPFAAYLWHDENQRPMYNIPRPIGVDLIRTPLGPCEKPGYVRNPVTRRCVKPSPKRLKRFKDLCRQRPLSEQERQRYAARGINPEFGYNEQTGRCIVVNAVRRTMQPCTGARRRRMFDTKRCRKMNHGEDHLYGPDKQGEYRTIGDFADYRAPTGHIRAADEAEQFAYGPWAGPIPLNTVVWEGMEQPGQAFHPLPFQRPIGYANPAGQYANQGWGVAPGVQPQSPPLVLENLFPPGFSPPPQPQAPPVVFDVIDPSGIIIGDDQFQQFDVLGDNFGNLGD